MSSLEEIYRFHHREERGRNFAFFPDERAEFFRARLGTGKKILDVGCRDCAFTRLFAKGNSVIGIDIDAVSLESCRAAGIEARQVDLNASEWHFGEGSFDAVVAGEIIEHVYYPERFFGKFFRLLKPGGILVGSTPNAFSLKNRIRLLFGTKRGTPLEDPTHINHFSYKEIRNLLRHAGFQNCEVLPLIVKGYLKPFAKIAPGLIGFSLFFVGQKPEKQ